MMTDLYWDPYDPALRVDPYPLWRRMRDEAPVWYNSEHDFWAISRFEDIKQASKNWQAFSSAHGTTLEVMTPEPIGGGMMIWLDPPKHTLLRRVVSQAFSQRRMRIIENDIRTVCARLLDPHVGAGGFDYIQDFAAILPPTIISALLGVPESDQERLRQLVDDVFSLDDEAVGMMNEKAQHALGAIRDYIGEQCADRRANPRDDMLTELVEAEFEDEGGTTRRFTDDEVRDFGLLLFSAGSETTARHLGWVASLLDEYPDQRAALAKDSDLIPNAIEEILRLEPPSPVNARWLKSDVTVQDVTMPAGSKVILLTGSAGRDERQYENPDVLDIRRKFDLHLSFGYGVHFCLGAALARMEGRIALEETLERWPEWGVDRENTRLLYTSTVRGPVELPLITA